MADDDGWREATYKKSTAKVKDVQRSTPVGGGSSKIVVVRAKKTSGPIEASSEVDNLANKTANFTLEDKDLSPESLQSRESLKCVVSAQISNSLDPENEDLRLCRNQLSHAFDFTKGKPTGLFVPVNLPKEWIQIKTEENTAWQVAPYVLHAVKEYFYYLATIQQGPIFSNNDSKEFVRLLSDLPDLRGMKELLTPEKIIMQQYNKIKNSCFVGKEDPDFCNHIILDGSTKPENGEDRKKIFERWELENFGKKTNTRQLVVKFFKDKFPDHAIKMKFDGLRENQTFPMVQTLVEMMKPRSNVEEPDRIKFIKQVFVAVPLAKILRAGLQCCNNELYGSSPEKHPVFGWFFEVGLKQIDEYIQNESFAGRNGQIVEDFKEKIAKLSW